MAVLLVRDDREYLCEPGEELQTDLGVLEVPSDVTPGRVIETHLGEAFRVRRLRGPDLFHHLERTGAPMHPRDVGLVVGHAGVEAGDSILDAGTGTGILAACLGRLDASVVTFERDASFAEVARENMRVAGVDDRVTVRGEDVRVAVDEFSEGEFDVVTLDMPDAETVVAGADRVLVSGGALAVYSPFLEDARAVVEAARASGLERVRALETIQREMDVDERGTRPTPTGVGHTGYLTFARAP